MSTLLVLGSAPSPRLPPANAFDAIACANASIASAAKLRLPPPEITVISAFITNNSELGQLQLEALRGLATRQLIYLPYTIRSGSPLKRLFKRVRKWRLKPMVLKWHLAKVGFRYDQFIVHAPDYYVRLAISLTDADETLERTFIAKGPSTGMVSLLMGMADERFDRFVLAGFNFERTQAFAENSGQLLHVKGQSPHAVTDLLLLRRLRECHENIFTTERVVAEHTSLPMFQTCKGS